ncbi:MAG: hypothetical protein JNM28_12830 [Armatimonadetes bacterium]|jgi:hypothetical protein|nr:hypothetical protein [Armatimonadota bacterium]
MWLPTPTEAEVERFRELLQSTCGVECDSVEARALNELLIQVLIIQTNEVHYLRKEIN